MCVHDYGAHDDDYFSYAHDNEKYLSLDADGSDYVYNLYPYISPHDNNMEQENYDGDDCAFDVL